MTTMRCVRIHGFGGPEVLSVEEMAAPHPAGGEVLVRVRAASVNPVDAKIRSGRYPKVQAGQLPLMLGRDVAGEVVESGGGAGLPAVGTSVHAMLGWDRGGYAAAVPLAGLTAWQGLFDHGGLQAGKRVLIHGGAGAIVATTMSGDDLAFARELGADQAVDYKADRFEERVEPVDVVFGLVAGETQARSWSVLKPGGILVSTLGPPDEEQARAHGAGYMAQPNGLQLAEIDRLIADGRVRQGPVDREAERGIRTRGSGAI